MHESPLSTCRSTHFKKRPSRLFKAVMLQTVFVDALSYTMSQRKVETRKHQVKVFVKSKLTMYVISTMGVSKELISKYLIGN